MRNGNGSRPARGSPLAGPREGAFFTSARRLGKPWRERAPLRERMQTAGREAQERGPRHRGCDGHGAAPGPTEA